MFRVYSTKEFPGLQASTELTKVNSSKYIFQSDLSFLFFSMLKSILLDGEFVLIFEKLNEDGEKKGELAQSIIFLIIASGSVLKLVGPLVKMLKPSNIATTHPKIENFGAELDTSSNKTTVQFNDFNFISHNITSPIFFTYSRVKFLTLFIFLPNEKKD